MLSAKNKLAPEYNEAKWRVKIAHFTEKDYSIRGVVHVGANDGYEVPWYFALGAEKVLAFEPLPLAVGLFKDKCKQFLDSGVCRLYDVALSDSNQRIDLRIAKDSGQCSTFLRVNDTHKTEAPFRDTEEEDTPTVEVSMTRFDQWANSTPDPITLSDYNCLVVDVQGMELPVLRGFGDYLQYFDFLNIECSKEPIFVGEADAQTVADYLEKKGFMRDTPIEDHNDVMFIKKGALHA